MPRVRAALRARGVRCGSHRVARLMRAAGLAGCHRRRRTRTTIAEPTHVPAPNRIARDCTAPRPDRLWLGDITSIATQEGWLYLAVLLDAHARRVVGWAMADHLRAELALDALTMALRARHPGAGLVHHTDRGCQYTAVAYQSTPATHGVTCSMSRAFLRHPQGRAGRHQGLADAGGGSTGHLRMDRGVVQPPTPPLHARLPDARRPGKARVVVVEPRRLALICPC